MTRHRFINNGRSPIPMGGDAKYACVCGKRGTHAAIERHIAESSVLDDQDTRDATPTATYEQLADNDDFVGGNTMAHYLPMEPRAPAPTPFNETDLDSITPTELPPTSNIIDELCRLCDAGAAIADLHLWIQFPQNQTVISGPRSIAELFQDMLRSAFQAGTVSTATGESFETWYQREVLQ